MLSVRRRLPRGCRYASCARRRRTIRLGRGDQLHSRPDRARSMRSNGWRVSIPVRHGRRMAAVGRIVMPISENRPPVCPAAGRFPACRAALRTRSPAKVCIRLQMHGPATMREGEKNKCRIRRVGTERRPQNFQQNMRVETAALELRRERRDQEIVRKRFIEIVSDVWKRDGRDPRRRRKARPASR